MPNNSFSPDDPFHAVDPLDGYHVQLLERGGVSILSVQFRAAGDVAPVGAGWEPDVELLDLRDPTPAQLGGVTRLQRVMAAVCTYFNTGGSWRELGDALKAVEKLAPGGLVFPGYHYVATYPTDDGDQHVFAKDGSPTGEAALWQAPEPTAAGGLAGGWIEKTTLDEILEDQADDDAGWGGPRTVETAEADAGGAAEGAGHPAPLQLPARPGDRLADADQGRGDPGVPPHDPGRPAG